MFYLNTDLKISKLYKVIFNLRLRSPHIRNRLTYSLLWQHYRLVTFELFELASLLTVSKIAYFTLRLHSSPVLLEWVPLFGSMLGYTLRRRLIIGDCCNTDNKLQASPCLDFKGQCCKDSLLLVTGKTLVKSGFTKVQVILEFQLKWIDLPVEGWLFYPASGYCHQLLVSHLLTVFLSIALAEIGV